MRIREHFIRRNKTQKNRYNPNFKSLASAISPRRIALNTSNLRTEVSVELAIVIAQAHIADRLHRIQQKRALVFQEAHYFQWRQ